MNRNAAFPGVIRWSASGSRTGALVMRAAPSRSRELVRPKLAAIMMSGCHLVPVICVGARAGVPRAGRAPRRHRAVRVPGDGPHHHDGHTVLTGLLDRSALYGVLAEIEALGLDLLEIRQLPPQYRPPESDDRRSP